MDIKTAGKLKKRKLGKTDKELKRLEKIVFGDPSELFNEQSTSVKKTKKRHISGIYGGDEDEDCGDKPKPVWEDEDDLLLSVQEAHEIRGKPNANHPGKPTDSYDSLLKKRFENIAGNPKWAELKTKKNRKNVDGLSDDGEDDVNDDDDDDDNNILQRCGNFVKKSKKLTSGDFNFSVLKDLNTETQREGKIIKAVEFHPTSPVALVAGFSGIATVFDINGKTNPKIQMVKFPKFDIHCARFTHGGDQFVVGSKRYRHFYSYDMMSGRSLLIPAHHETGITNMENFEISPKGDIMTVCGKFGNIFLVSVKTKEWIGSLRMNGEVNAISFNSDGSVMYSHGEDGQVYVWDMNSRSCVHKFVDDGCLKGTSVCVSPDDKLLACGSSSGVVNLYETSTLLTSNNPQPVKILNNLTTAVTALKFNHSSEVLAMASGKKDSAVRLMHYPSLSVYKNFPVPNKSTGLINCVSFSPHSGYLAIGSNFGKAILFRLNYFGNY